MKKLAFIGLVLVIVFGTVYVVGQQVLRLSANDPQIQLAENVATILNGGTSPENAISGHVDMSTSLSPFVIIYDKNGKVVSGSGYLGDSIPTVPFGVLTHASGGHDNWVTWQPQNGVRLASVTAAANDYYVLSGRNLREVEKHEEVVLLVSVLGWLASIVAVVAGYKFLQVVDKRKK